jgi:hypothetical protein
VIVFVSGKTVIVHVFVQDPSPEFGMTKKTSRLEVAFGKSEARASHHVYPDTNHDHEHGFIL